LCGDGRMIKKNLILGLMLFGLVGCATIFVNNNEKAKDSNKMIEDINSTKKVITIDLDEKIKEEDYSKGSLRKKDTKIPIFIGNENDEVVLKGELLKIAKKIKIGENDEVAFSGKKFTIKTTELKDGDIIIITYGEGKKIKMRARRY
jgi:flagellar biosynthesis regulator FlaF